MKRVHLFYVIIAFMTTFGCASQPSLVKENLDIKKDVSMAQNLSDLEHLKNVKKCKCSYNKRFTFFENDLQALKRVAKENYTYAFMSANAYTKDFQVRLPQWTRAKRYVQLKHGFGADVYVSENEKNVVIAFRGTDDMKGDWLYGNADTDSHGQYADADYVYNKVRETYVSSKIVTVGHSLGGGLALHVSVTHKDVDAVVFNTSPRVFIPKTAKRYNNKVSLIYETGEVLAIVRQLFVTLGKIEHQTYRYNYLGGNLISEHGIADFATCMYLSTIPKKVGYEGSCKDNTWF